VLFERHGFDPALPGIAQGSRLQRDVRRQRLPALGCGVGELGQQLLQRVRVIAVFHARSDQVRQLSSFGRECLLHDPRGLDLPVQFAAVGVDRHLEQVSDVSRHVVHVPQCLFVGGWIGVGRQSVVACGFGESGAGTDGDPMIGVMRAQMPGAGAAHREADQHHAFSVNRVVFLDMLDGLQHIGLAGRFESQALASERVQNQRIGGRDLSDLFHALMNKMQIGGLVTASVQPDVQCRGLLEVPSVGNDQSIGLGGSIDTGCKSAHD
jgi:hypothetical protein